MEGPKAMLEYLRLAEKAGILAGKYARALK
jgi:hypothetical protein